MATRYKILSARELKTDLTDNSDSFIASQKAVKTAVDAKQATLVSGTNIKTINSTSLLGSGDIAISGSIADGDKGDITVSGTGATWTIDNKAVSLAKMADLAQNTIIGRVTASTGVPEALTAANVRTIINVADGATANAKATGAEINTGTDDVKFATAKAIADSDIFRAGKSAQISALTDKATPVDADVTMIEDSAATNAKKKLTWSNLKATLKTYFDTVYQAALVSGTNIKTINSTTLLGSGDIAITVPVKATGAEVDTGTDDAKFVTAKALVDSSYEKNPMTTAGDIIYGGTSGAPTRLAKGTAGQVLKMNSGATAPEWGEGGGGGFTAKTVFTKAVFNDDFSSSPDISSTAIDESTGRVTKIIIPHTISANKVSISKTSAAAGGIIRLSLYSEDGATKLWTESISSSTDAVQVATLSTTRVIPAGVYYLMLSRGDGTNVGNVLVFRYVSASVSMVNPGSGLPVLNGTLSISSGTHPDTIDPTAITVATPGSAHLRFDN